MPLSLAPALLALALATGCVGGPGATGKEGATEGAGNLATETIAVTPLQGPEASPVKPAEAAAAEAQAPPEAEAGETEPPKAEPGAAAPAAEEAPPAPPKSPEQLACEKKGGTWASAGGTGAKACVRRTRDGGKKCSSGLQCEGDCLARSQSCSPIAPLFGCNDILQDNGARVTQCID